MKKWLVGLFILLMAGVAVAGSTDIYKIQWTTAVTGVNDLPDATTLNGTAVAADYAIPAMGAETISVVTNTALDAGSCTNTATTSGWSLNVLSSNDGTTFDTGTGTAYYVTYAGHADALVVTQPGITPGPMFLKFRADEDASADLCLTIYVTVHWR